MPQEAINDLRRLGAAADKRYSLAIQPAPPGLRAEETCVPLDVPLRSTPHMTGKPLVPFWARTLAWSGCVFDIGEVRGYRCGGDDHPV